ncbi:MAG: hypothetical protein ACOCZ5_00920 [bacterium]
MITTFSSSGNNFYSENENKTIKIIDHKTEESLPGVKITYDDTCIYSDLNGVIKETIPDGTYIEINLISYKKKKIVLDDSVITIKLQKEN